MNVGNFFGFRRIMGMAVPDQFCSPLTGFGQPFFIAELLKCYIL